MTPTVNHPVLYLISQYGTFFYHSPSLRWVLDSLLYIHTCNQLESVPCFLSILLNCWTTLHKFNTLRFIVVSIRKNKPIIQICIFHYLMQSLQVPPLTRL